MVDCMKVKVIFEDNGKLVEDLTLYNLERPEINALRNMLYDIALKKILKPVE